MHSIDYNRRSYESKIFLPAGIKKHYVLEPYPPSTRHIREYNPPSNRFRPITPPYFDQQLHDDYINAFNRPCVHRSDNRQSITDRQRRNFNSYQRPFESSPTSDIDFAMEKLGGNDKPNNDLEVGRQPKKSTRRHLLNNLFDFLALAATCIIFALIYLISKPFQRGFFCDDTSIQYPYKPDTVPMWLLAVYGGLGPVLIFIVVEIWVVRPIHCGRVPTNNIKQRRIDYFKTIFQTIFLFALGVAICFLITEVGKRTIGRLRPYYLTICNPDWANIQCTKTVITANGTLVIPQYVIKHNCNSNASEKDLKEAKLSFPSGHSSYATYAFLFLFVYFEARLVCPNVQFFKPFLQCLCIAIAFFTCLSRVTDYKHHPTDVIGGAIIGFCIAIFAAVRVGTYLWSFSVYCETEDETKKDRLPDDERVHVPGLEIRQNGSSRFNDDTQLANSYYKRQPYTTQSSYGNRSQYGNGTNVQSKHNSSNSTHNQISRVSPSGGFDGPNN